MAALRHLAVYLPHLRQGGGESSLLRLAGGFARQGIVVDLLVHALATAELALPDGVRLHELGCRSTLAAIPRLARALRRLQPQCLLSAFPHSNLAALAAVGLSRSACRCVISEHAPVSRQVTQQGGWRYRVLPPLLRLLYRRADAVVAVSAGVADDLRRLVGAGLPVAVIANPVLTEASVLAPPDAPLHPWLLDSRLRVVLAVCRLAPEKDLPSLMRAFAGLWRRRPESRLLVLGDGPERAGLEVLRDQLGITAVADLPGRVAAPLPWMRAAAALALASRFEGFGNVLIEALACGIPVVSTDCPVGPRELLAGGRHGALVPVGDPDAMAAALEHAIDAGAPPGAREYALGFTDTRACLRYRMLIESRLPASPC